MMVRGIRDVHLRKVQIGALEFMTLADVIEFVGDHGYSTEAMSNEEIYAMANDILDGHLEELEEPEELRFDD
jgi:hypothetical protein